MTTESFQASSLAASLTCSDLQASLTFYRDVLGFAVSDEREHEGKLSGARVTAGSVMFLLNQDNGAKGANRVKGAGMSFYIVTSQDVNELAAGIKQRGGTLETEAMKAPWGPTIFRVVDPSGFKLTISSG